MRPPAAALRSRPVARSDAPDGLERFDPRRHERELEAILAELEAATPAPTGASDAEAPLDAGTLDRILRKHPRDGKGLFSRSQILAGWRHLRAATAPDEETAFARRIRLRPVRTQSGVTPVTVLTRPFPCPGRCVFCPNDVRMPKSYLAAEPGAQRAAANRFDPYTQTWSRLAAYRDVGHPTDKVELIVLGGTFQAYPAAYRRWFVARCLEALGDFGSGRDRRTEASIASAAWATSDWARALAAADPGRGSYNRRVRAVLRQGGRVAKGGAGRGGRGAGAAGWEDVERAQRANETAVCRCVGLSVETRPDCVDEAEARHLRRLGVTKVQLGVQSLSDEVLARNGRGHDVEATRRAARTLRTAGFKLQVHWMPNLLGATPEGDVADFERLVTDPDVRPDELKIYPCSLVESADLVRHWRSGAWRPYSHDELLRVVVEALRRVPRWCRVTRVVRDISSDDILVGNKRTNFREIAERELAARGEPARDVRAREIRGAAFAAGRVRARATEYDAGVAREVFLERTTRDDRLLGFLRLSLPRAGAGPAELAGAAMVRELHVYGAALPLGARGAGAAQHRGLGSELLREAAERAAAAGYARLAVISAVGTRPYYRRHGFGDGRLYQVRPLRPARHGP